MRSEMRWLLRAFALLALAAGFLLFVGSEETDRFFSWTIKPPLTAAFLGASYWAAFVLLAWSARQRLWVRARAALPPVLVIAVLLLVATLIHFERFHRDRFGWFWAAAYVAVPPLLVALAWRQEGLAEGDSGDRVRLPKALRALLAVQGVVMAGLGASLFVAPTSADAAWPWDLTPLTARALGAFLLGFGVAALHAVFENDLFRFEGAAVAYAAIGALELIAAARYPGDFTGADVDTWLYVGFLSSVLLAGRYGSLRACSRSSPRRAASAASGSA